MFAKIKATPKKSKLTEIKIMFPITNPTNPGINRNHAIVNGLFRPNLSTILPQGKAASILTTANHVQRVAHSKSGIFATSVAYKIKLYEHINHAK